MGIVRAHIDLGKAEASEIGGEVARAAALGCLAAAALFFVGILVPVGTTLFLGEWLFGSMGWGVLLGALWWVGIAVTAILVALRVTGVQWSLAAALAIAIAFALLFAFRVPRSSWIWIGDQVGVAARLGTATAPVVGLVILGLIGAVIGLVVGMRGGGKMAIGGLVLGLVAGILLGLFSAINFDRKGGAATGIAIGLLAWPILMLARLAQVGVDGEALKQRFYPETTINTAKETWEWVRARTPLGPRS